MNKTISTQELALINNDLRNMTAQERLSLYNKTCESLGLNTYTQPFGYIEFRGGKLSLYAKKDATDQLRKIHKVSVEIVSKETILDNFIVIAKAVDSDNRTDEDMGSVCTKGLSGESLGNAMMKAITKAKRRVTLSICGLGILDETEVETIKDATVLIENKKEEVIAPEIKKPEIKTTNVLVPDPFATVLSRNMTHSNFEMKVGPLCKWTNLGQTPEAEAKKWIAMMTVWKSKNQNTAISSDVELSLKNVKEFWGVV